ncbi:MAG: universal stress protein [Desulfobacterales bacterium]|nr:universal stress protein [Desulfobacterales bacterium]
MSKKILIALDNSKNSLKAVKYVASSLRPTATVTMFSVLPEAMAACELGGPSHPLLEANIETFCTIDEAKESAVQGFMEEAKKVLVKAGFPSKDVYIKVRKKKAGIARHILKEAQAGKYDTLVMGRRGLSGIKEFVFGSVSNKVLHLAKNFSIIIVD